MSCVNRLQARTRLAPIREAEWSIFRGDYKQSTGLSVRVKVPENSRET
jgi:hypothetical protein